MLRKDVKIKWIYKKAPKKSVPSYPTMSKKSFAQRHRKVMRDAIQGITKPALKRLAQRAGVKRIGGIVYQELRGIMKIALENVMRDAIIFTEHHRKKTVGKNEVKEALALRGVNILYHEKKAKVVKTGDGKDKKSEDKKEGDKKKSHNDITLDTYIYKVLKQVHPSTGINAGAKSQLNQFLMVLLRRLNNVARDLSSFNEKKTLTSREVQSAVGLFLPGELAKHAVSEGTKAVTKFNYSSRAVKGTSASRAFRAGLTFAPSRVENLMRGIRKLNSDFKINMRIGSVAPVYMAAVLEYVCAEILELAGNAAKDNGRVRITSRHIFLAIFNDDELNKLIDDLGVVIAKGGVVPNIHTALLPKKKRPLGGELDESQVY